MLRRHGAQLDCAVPSQHFSSLPTDCAVPSQHSSSLDLNNPGPWGNTWARNTFLRSLDRLPLHDAVRGMLKEQNRKAVKRARRMEKQA